MKRLDLNRARVFIFDIPEQVAEAAAERFVELTTAATHSRERCSVALAGGSTPKRLYQLLTSPRFRERIDWFKLNLFFGDERCVPPDHADSNFRMVKETLISKIEIPAINVHRIVGEADAEDSARAYEANLKTFFGPGRWPRFDVVLLGMGEDGHTASIFPDSDALCESQKWVAVTETKGQRRITLTLPVLNHAAATMFLVTGEQKAPRLAQVLRTDQQNERVPAQLVRPVDGLVEWFVDNAAASLL